MKEVKIKLFKFSELCDKAKEKARQWWREMENDTEFAFGDVTEDALEILKYMGFTDAKIWWSGFCSQGDGACFQGRWSAMNVKPGKAKEHASIDEEIHRIASIIEEVAAKHPESSVNLTHVGHYYHYNTIDFEDHEGFDLPETEERDAEVDEEAEAGLKEASQDMMKWIYRKLEEQNDWYYGDEHIDEDMEEQEYMFRADGRNFNPDDADGEEEENEEDETE